MKTSFKKMLAGLLAVGTVLTQSGLVFAQGEVNAPKLPEPVMYLYNHNCEDLTMGATVGTGAYLSSTNDVMNRVVATPDKDASNGQSIKVTATKSKTQYYKIFTRPDTWKNTWLDGNEEDVYPTDYNNEVIVSFDVYREEGQRTPNFTIQNVNMNNLTLAAGFIDTKGTLSVALSKTGKSMASENASGSIDFHRYDKTLEANKWHNISIVYNKNEEKTSWYANGEYVCDAAFPTENETYQSKKGFIYSFQCFALVNEGLAASAYIDNIKVAYAKPQTTKEIQETLYENKEESGWTVTKTTITSENRYVFSNAISEVKKNYMVEFDFEADTVYSRGAGIYLENAANNALASAFMATDDGALVVRTEMTEKETTGSVSQGGLIQYTKFHIQELNKRKLYYVKDVFRANERTNFKFYVDVNEHVVYYYVNDIYAGKTAANPAYDMTPARMRFVLPDNKITEERKFHVYDMKVGYTEPGQINVSKLGMITDQGFEVVDGSELSEGDEVCVNATVVNETLKDAELMFVIVQYSDERMIDTKVVTKTIPANGELTIDNECSLVISPEVTSIKAFVWGADGSLMPYCDGAEAVPNIL